MLINAVLNPPVARADIVRLIHFIFRTMCETRIEKENLLAVASDLRQEGTLFFSFHEKFDRNGCEIP